MRNTQVVLSMVALALSGCMLKSTHRDHLAMTRAQHQEEMCKLARERDDHATKNKQCTSQLDAEVGRKNRLAAELKILF